MARRFFCAPILLAACTPVELPPPAQTPPPEAMSRPSGIVSIPIRFDDLPSGALLERIQPPGYPEPGPAPGDPTDELLIEASSNAAPGVHSIRVRDGVLATIWFGGADKGSHQDEVRCGALADNPYLMPLRWATLEPKGDGALLVVRDGWIDYTTCGVTIATRRSILAAPLVPGLLYAFRGESTLVLLFPGTSSFVASAPTEGASLGAGSIGLTALPLDDHGLSFVALVEPHVWMDAMHPRDAIQWAASSPRVDVGLEVTRSSRDSDALAIAYVTAPRPPAPPPFDKFEFLED